MDPNPYASPRETNDDRLENASIQYRVFKGNLFSFRLSEFSLRDSVREKAQLAIEAEIGAKNVVSIAESADPFTGFSVTVWYRA